MKPTARLVLAFGMFFTVTATSVLLIALDRPTMPARASASVKRSKFTEPAMMAGTPCASLTAPCALTALPRRLGAQ
jgi:hypothetical protein